MRFTVKNREISTSDGSRIAVIGDNADYKIEFEFDSEWSGVVKTARFVRGKDFMEQILVNDECKIPIEVLKQGFLEIGVFSAEMTTTPCRVLVKASIKEIGEQTAPPTPDAYRQIVKMIEDLQIVGVTDAQIERAVREYLEENPVSGVDDAEVQRIVADYIELHKSELKGDKGDKGDQGARGEKGEQGEKGDKGDKGDTGANGKDGVDGLDGSNGVDGKSAYDIAVDNGFKGTEKEWLESLKGADGVGGGSASGIVWTEDSVLLLKDILYSCVYSDANGKVKVDALVGSLIPDYVPEEPTEPDVPEEPTVTLSSISATKTTTEYTVGDTFNASDIVVTAHYSDGTTRNVTSSAVIDSSAVNSATAGTYTINVRFTDGNITKTTTLTVTYIENSGSGDGGGDNEGITVTFTPVWTENYSINPTSGLTETDGHYSTLTPFDVQGCNTLRCSLKAGVSSATLPNVIVSNSPSVNEWVKSVKLDNPASSLSSTLTYVDYVVTGYSKVYLTSSKSNATKQNVDWTIID